MRLVNAKARFCAEERTCFLFRVLIKFLVLAYAHREFIQCAKPGSQHGLFCVNNATIDNEHNTRFGRMSCCPQKKCT